MEKLIAAAEKVMRHAYAPYSNFHVGAAILLDNGQIFTGCNVENASYGLTICAERNAIFAAVAATTNSPQGKIRIRAVAVATSQPCVCAPCGACRQVISEFSTSDTLIYYQGPDGLKQATLAELLPDRFSL